MDHHIAKLSAPVQKLRDYLTEVLPSDPLVLIGGTAVVFYVISEVKNSIPRDGAKAGMKRVLFRVARKIPAIRNEIETEISKAEKSIEEDMKHLFTAKAEDAPKYIKKLPWKGLEDDKIIAAVEDYMTKLGKYTWEDGLASGSVYHGGKELTELNTKVFSMATWTNPLHPDLFPGVCKMEAEVVRMTADLFHGSEEAVGSVTSGGTESIILAVKAYRDYAINVKGIKNPEVLIPVTAHAAFDKAAELLSMKIRHVEVDPKTCRVRLDRMEKMINRNTCMLVGSAPAFPHGIIDNIADIGQLGVKYNIPVHVDACLGGFLLAFMPKAGFNIPPFDFKVAGVTSMSADTHKYGFAPKGSSVLMFSNKKYKHHQYFLQPNWPGGIYASPTIAGSRPGVVIAGCWSSMLFFGLEGYVNSTKKIIQAARAIETGLRAIPEIKILGEPQVSVVAFGSDAVNIYQVAQGLNERGWNLNNLQFPACVHICVTHLHTPTGVVDRFLKDVREVVDVLKLTPSQPTEGSAALYASSQQIPDRSLVNDIIKSYMDSLYRTDFEGSTICDYDDESTVPIGAQNGMANGKPVRKNAGRK